MVIAGGGGFGGFELSEKDIVSGIDSEIQYYRDESTWVQWVGADGVVSATKDFPLAHNALVRAFTLDVGAARADRTTLDNAGQVRLQVDDGDSKIIVVDFGTLRSVSGVGYVGNAGDPSLRICSLRAFKGDGFGDTDLYLEDCTTTDPDGEMIRSKEANSFETRTDRVRISVRVLSGTATLPQISRALYLEFPDVPADLDVRINGGAPAWTAPGVAQKNTNGWDANTHRIADITAALAAMTGDPHDDSALTASVVLSSRIPASLSIDAATMDVAYLARITFGTEEQQPVVFDQEGVYDVPLTLPSWAAAVQEVRFTATGAVPAERILEPVGPPIAVRASGDGSAYDQLLDVDHAASALLTTIGGFSDLTAIRLPLRAGADGAEVRVVLYAGNDDGPTKPIDGGTSKPVDLDPATNDDDVWTSFTMTKPVKLDPTITYWAVVVVGRGSASWSLGSFPSPAVPVPIRRGAANGPWYELPNVIVGGAPLGARIRTVGKAPAPAPIAPIVVTVAGHESSHIDVTPTAKGAGFTWRPSGSGAHPSFAPVGHAITLRLTSRMTGTVTLSAIDVIATK